MLQRVLKVLVGVAGVGIGAILLLAFWPMQRLSLAYTPLPRLSFHKAVEQLEQADRDASPGLQAECGTQLLHHGHPTERVFVLLHGLSNCPAQFRALGELLFQRGANVVIPRLPFHGEKDRMTEDWKGITAQMMLDTANQAVDRAHSLGRRVTVSGISVNATIAAWLAQERPDIDQVVLLAPFLAPKDLPDWALGPAARLIQRLPNRFFWWDRKKKAGDLRGHAYPRFPSHAVAQTMRVSRELLEAARTRAPRCRSLLVVTTASDESASPSLTRMLVSRWRRLRPEAARTYEFPREERIDHDFIDPSSATQRVDLVYPRLLALLGMADLRPNLVRG